MPRVTGRSAKHLFVGDNTDVALSVDRIRSDEQLLRLAVNETIRGRAADALRSDDLLQVGRDFIQQIRRTFRLMRRVGDDPKPIRPRYDGARAALAFVVEHREMRIDAAYLEGRGRRRCTSKRCSKRGKHER